MIRAAVAKTYDQIFPRQQHMNQIVQWFDLGGEIQLRDTAGAQEMLHKLRGIQGLMDKLGQAGLGGKENLRDRWFRRQSLCSKACMPTSASAAAKSACSRRGKNSLAARSKTCVTTKKSATSAASAGRLISG